MKSGTRYSAPLSVAAKENNSIYSMMGTFPGFAKKVQKTNPDKFSSLTNITFNSLNFNPHSSNKKSVFEGIPSEMNLMATVYGS